MNPDQQKNYWEEKPEAVASTDTDSQPPLTPSQQVQSVPDAPVSWTASEYVHPEKNGLWYVLFVVVALGLIAV